MTDQQNNKVLHELFGKCWHEPHRPDLYENYRCRHCKREYSDNEITYAEYGNPDYAADPRLILEGMREAGKEVEFIDYLFKRLFLGKPEWISYDAVYRIVELIRDKTGKLGDLAVEFFKQEWK